MDAKRPKQHTNCQPPDYLVFLKKIYMIENSLPIAPHLTNNRFTCTEEAGIKSVATSPDYDTTVLRANSIQRRYRSAVIPFLVELSNTRQP